MKSKQKILAGCVVMIGNLTTGYEAYGPYQTIEDAWEAHGGEECWILNLNEPLIWDEPATMVETTTTDANVVDMFDYKEHWSPEQVEARNKKKDDDE